MNQNYPIDVQGAKNTKLFKKFMQSKNKSTVVHAPKIQNIVIHSKQEPKIQQYNFAKQPKNINYSPHQRQTSQQKVYNSNKLMQNFRPTVPKVLEHTFQMNNQKNISKFNEQHIQIQQQNNYHKRNDKRQTEAPLKNQLQSSKKYEKLQEQYNQLKQKVMNERKQNKKQFIRMQEQIDMLQKKIFQLRNKEDELILQNKRIKQKSAFQFKQKQLIQQSNRQLTYQVQQLKDILDGQQNSVKKREDQTIHWRKLNDDLKQRVKDLELQVVRLKDLNNMFERQKYVSQKQVSNKQQHLNDMRQKINSLITQNGVLRDQIFHITSKLYHFQQQNKSLRSDLKRHSQDFSVSYMQSQLQHPSSYNKQPSSAYQYKQGSQEKPRIQSTENFQKKTERRRGQFARQRGARRVQNQIPNNMPKQNNNFVNQKQATKTQSQPIVNQNSNNQSKDVAQAMRKLQQLNQQVQKLKDMKAMNGGMRRQKINLQRQIQQIQEFLKSRQ